jgi:hypothetical protein
LVAGTEVTVQFAQKILPQILQWCLRTSMLNGVSHS